MSIASTGLGKNGRHVVNCQTYHIEEVAKLFGVGRNTAYAAAANGDFPTIKIGGRLVAPKLAIDRMLGIKSDEPPASS
jgi:predicted DNA-binding transcriptional regulator AlpA